jgi:hypothetical protein
MRNLIFVTAAQKLKFICVLDSLVLNMISKLKAEFEEFE